MRKMVLNRISGILLGIVCGVSFVGCSLVPEVDEYEATDSASVSDNDVSASSSSNMVETEATEEESSTDELVVVLNDGSGYVVDDDTGETRYVYETVEIEDLDEPVDENGEWTDYILGTDELRAVWDDELSSYGHNGVLLYIIDYPVIYVSDSEKEAELNESLSDIFQNYFVSRFQLKDLYVELTCSVLYESRIVSYQFEGMVYHTGSDIRYEDEREYIYYVTIDRMTGAVINLETAYGVENAYEDILNGDYEVIRADDSVFENFDDDLLADVYVSEPALSDDIDHQFDFYIEDGHVYVLVWVGEENGSYAILKLGESKL